MLTIRAIVAEDAAYNIYYPKAIAAEDAAYNIF